MVHGLHGGGGGGGGNGGGNGAMADPGGMRVNGMRTSGGAQGAGTHTHVGAPRGPRGGGGPGGNGHTQGGGNQRAPSQRPQRPSEEQRALFGLNLDKVHSHPNPNPNPSPSPNPNPNKNPIETAR